MTIYVCESHPLMRRSIAMLLLRSCPKTKVIEVENLSELQTSILKNGDPTLFTIDPTITTLKGTEGIKKIKTLFPETPILIYSSIPSEDAEEICKQAGADYFIEKSTSIRNTISKITNIFNKNKDEVEITSEKSDVVDFSTIKLTRRHMQLLTLIDLGLSNDDIGANLNISPHTVKVHLWRLYRRFNVKSRTQLLNIARKNGLI